MRTIAIALACLASTAAHAKDAAVEAPVNAFVTAFNKGDTVGASATMVDKVAITDEVAPFHWHGKDAFATWGADYQKDATAKGITDPAVTIGAPTRELVDGDHAYLIVPATYRFTQKGVKMVEVAQMTFSLDKGAAGWKIAGWTWTGPNPTPAK